MQHDTRTAFLDQLVATPAGRAHVLSISVEAEEGDEGGIFDQLADIVDDPKLRRIVETHRDDEVRHAQLFRDCLTRLDLELQPVPETLRIIPQIAARVGGGFGGELTTTDQAVAVYALLFAIEERGVEQFPLIADAFRAVDPETADIYMRVTRDERGHVRYCETIGRHYADEKTWRGLVAYMRTLEEAAFESVRAADLAYCTDRGLVSVAP